MQQMLRSPKEDEDEEARLGGGQRLADEIERFEGLLARVVEQTERRVLKGESVKADEKLVSLFEEHTAIIRGAKRPRRPSSDAKCGSLRWRGASSRATASSKATQPMKKQLQPTLEDHLRLFGRPPSWWRRTGECTQQRTNNPPQGWGSKE